MAHTTQSRESGQGTIELAFSLPLFVLLILGGAEIGNLAWASVQVNNAARAGAAYASISHANAATTAANLAIIQAAAQNEAPKLTLTTTATDVCYCVTAGVFGTADVGCTSTSTQAGSCPSPSVIDVDVRVNTQATVRTFVHYPGLPSSYTVHAQATLGVEQ